jgi:hypothetical protein
MEYWVLEKGINSLATPACRQVGMPVPAFHFHWFFDSALRIPKSAL